MTLLLKLVVAHLIGDFPLQPNDWAARKREPGVLIRHLAVHAALLAFVVVTSGPSSRLWIAATGLLVVHGIIDWVMGGRGKKTLSSLLLDQTLHAGSIVACFAVMAPSESRHGGVRILEHLSRHSVLTLLAGALVCVWFGRYLIGAWIARIAPEITKDDERQRGLLDAGGRIGMFERLLIFFALVFKMEALAGFVIGVKALLRLPEATESKNRALAEYFLLGTLASAAWAVLIALLTKALMEAGP